jgi:hypothetical protein
MNKKIFNNILLNLFVSKYTGKISKSLLFKLLNFQQKNSLVIDNKKINQIYNDYNISFMNERTIEIPFVLHLLKKYIKLFSNLNILEIGNTLIHYENKNNIIKRKILDKYEVYPNVINLDLEDYKSTKKFNIIFSISTLEHIGSDYGENRNDSKFKKSISKCIELLDQDGFLIITLPIYYRNVVDDFIFENNMFLEKHFFLRKNIQNDWMKSTEKETKANKNKLIYNKNFPLANALFIGVIKKSN